ncbi:M20/M25/M40 family metallo-hydrolase [Streptomyces sp. NPDC020875]|uniref:M20 family metallopeptidase n=1 Tax=Streptomyces sp. NPDC020875 TaxID=3154898 RepID=UPI0033CFD23A
MTNTPAQSQSPSYASTPLAPPGPVVDDRTRRRVRAWLGERADEMAELLIRLVAVESENPPGRALGRCAGVLRDALAELGIEARLLPVTGAPAGVEDPAVVRATVGDGDRLLYFHGHFDVVPAQDRGQFAAVRAGGRITGRGTADMKGGLVGMVYGALAARELGLIDDGRIVLHLVCDEETGSVAGAGELVARGLIDPGALAVLTAEPSGGAIWHAARGALTLRVEVRGTEAHVGQAERGVNAFLRMLDLVRPVERYAAELAGRPTGFATGPGDPPGSQLVIGGLAGSGANFNVVPGTAYFTIDGRFNPEEDPVVEERRLRALIEEAARETGTEVTVVRTQLQPSAATDPDHPAAGVLARTVAAVEGVPARFELCPGILETRWYARHSVPAFGYGPGRLDVSHGPREYVEEAALHRTAEVYALYAGELLG